MKRALLIGSATYGLLGMEKDLRLMEELLEERAFQMDILEAERSTRAGILNAFEALIQSSSQDDAALVYYSGHGGLVPNPNHDPNQQAATKQVPYFQFLVPTDMAASSPGDFRGLLDVEFSDLLARLSLKTRNVTVILDCCHAARLVRNPGFRSRALPRVWEAGLLEHHYKVSTNLPTTHPAGNRYTVRLNGAGVMESACEYEGVDGDMVGMLTESLALALRNRRQDTISWLTAGQWARERVLSMNPSQRVDLAGPVRRLLFDTREAEATGRLRFFYDNQQPSLRGGRLHGVREGSIYAILPYDAEAYVPDLQMGEARVDKVLAGVSRVTLSANSSLEGGLQAFLIKEAFPAPPVLIEGQAPELLAGIVKSKQLRLAGKDEHQTLLATVQVEKGQMRVFDEIGLPVGGQHMGVTHTLATLILLARARLLRAFASGSDHFALDTQALTITWGRIVEGEKRPLPQTGAMLAVGDFIYIDVVNKSRQPLFINVFDLGMERTISLLTDEQRSGLELGVGEHRALGFNESGGSYDWEMIWPSDLPKIEPLPESLVVFVTDKPQDLSALETRSMVTSGSTRSALQNLVDQMGFGTTRDVRRQTQVDVRYAVTHLDFMLDPFSRAQPEAAFLQDTRPDLSFLAYATRGITAQRRLAVRLDELVVEKTRALLSTDIRLDIIVTTNRGQCGSVDSYQAATFRLPGVRDGDHLSFGKLAFHGTVTDFLGIAIWVSRHKNDGPDLGHLLQNDGGVQPAIGILGGSQAVAASLAAGAADTLANTASKLLAATCGASIGLYRTSFLAAEAFGLGRHPSQGNIRIQDFSLAYTIQAIDHMAGLKEER